ncbi:MAG: FAD-dependent oxidoreductase [Eubacteriales bacterium]|nr:FAD-dependent oxidoreductase [Eubacteriales bacterium]
MIRIQQLRLPLDYTDETLKKAAAEALHIPLEQVQRLHLVKRSLDARKKQDIHYIAALDVQVKKENAILHKQKNANITAVQETVYQYPTPGSRRLSQPPVIAGSGPAGLFCGLLLARCGYRPLILERGEDVDSRTNTVKAFWEGGSLNPNSNVQFGEGGAGTFSDGKLNTLVKDRAGRNRFVLETFVKAGADPDILYVNKPHIGTDVLRTVVKHIRREIEALGGEVRFKSQVTDVRYENDMLTGITVNHTETMDCSVLVAAVGHSARDTFEMLEKKQVPMTPKAFAVGLRIEHPQDMINHAQYGPEYAKVLPAADYKLTAKLKNGRGVYSFCMCPGGYVVNASSEQDALAVNGMSYRARDGKNANSALVVTVTPEDFGFGGVLSGVNFQRRLEQCAYRLGGGKVPVQTFEDFRNHRESKSIAGATPCILGGWQPANVRQALPEVIADSLEEGILLFDSRIHGFARPDALLSGVESRTSSPVRILRGDNFMSKLEGFYPCGEGAGYAGGIMSAAMDGMKTAEAVISAYRKF